MRWHGLAVIAGLVVAGCGDDVQPGCDPDASCAMGTGSGSEDGGSTAGASLSASGPSTASASSTAGSTGSADSSATDGSTSSASSGAGTLDGDTTAATGSSTASESDGSSTEGQGNVEYSAQVLIGALDRILVFKEDLDADRCTWIVLVSPDIGEPYRVTTPEGWAIETIQASDVGDACGSPSPAMFGAEVATSAEGSIELGAIGASGVYPCDVTVDVTAMFMGVLPGVPPSDALVADAIPVSGC